MCGRYQRRRRHATQVRVALETIICVAWAMGVLSIVTGR